MSHNNELFAISCTLLGESEKAIRVDTGDGVKWLPKSLIDNEGEIETKPRGATIEVEMPVWFLEKEGLI